MAARSMADAVRAVLVKRAFVPGDPSMGGGDPSAGGGMPPGGDPSMGGGMPPPGMDPTMGGGMPPPGVGGDPMAGMPMPPPDQGGAPQSGMINMTADEFTKFIKQMMAAFGQGGAASAQQQSQPDIGAKLDTLIAVLQAQGGQAAPVGVQ
jgi:hypothetical protein